MARIIGTIESLKSLKSELKNKRITRFNSVREINQFLTNYNSEKLTILNDTSDKLEIEYSETCINLKQKIKNKAQIINLETERIDKRISELKTKIDLFQSNEGDNLIKKLLSSLRHYYLKNQSNHFAKNKSKLISLSIKEISKNIEHDELFIKEYETEKQDLIEKRAKYKIEKLEYTRSILENSKNLISGAIGENLVVKEIKKLSDDYVLINDFKLNFSQPIFYKKHNERIKSIQIDHLLISKAGIFIIKTKNWSKSSVNSLNLRSPIRQIERANFALYVYISENITLKAHHWGEQKIPIRNLIVMINNKPKVKFKYVNVKLLNELNDYIRYFDPILTDNQLNKIII
ncbi:nuclease-related domain-containing protein [Cellulophaga tyrosinoxydans]|uniref:Nuclease-related domain-containing protein n=1 Tax=Cellulophaga tyrosinoxydans TaxID=504486 RepID=A0A1W2CM86_9FLAO|nr:nuclease-related domain-containing protein [Cellulophaga tyrosinoxydans]SMC86329.1 Nuclease-related domain-containing protein [Cellulophaga tyrosinoxydans]